MNLSQIFSKLTTASSHEKDELPADGALGASITFFFLFSLNLVACGLSPFLPPVNALYCACVQPPHVQGRDRVLEWDSR